MEEIVSEFCESGSICECFLALLSQPEFLNQVRAAEGRAPGFLKLLWFMHQYACVCVSAPEGINNQWCNMV